MLRSGVIFNAKWADLALSEQMGTPLLPRTKSELCGYPESTFIQDRTLLRLLRRLQLASPNDAALTDLSPGQFRRLFRMPFTCSAVIP